MRSEFGRSFRDGLLPWAALGYFPAHFAVQERENGKFTCDYIFALIDSSHSENPNGVK
jgi:hypothetical protein